MTGTKPPRNDFVLVSCKHDANFKIRVGLTSTRSHVNGALLCMALSVHMGNCKSPCDEFMLHVKYGAVQSGSSGTGLEVWPC